MDRDSCLFFHVIDLPDEAPTEGPWDFRSSEDAYHGHFQFGGKRVLDVGVATGSHAFYMEAQGADVVPYDLGPDHSWDILVTESQSRGEVLANMRSIIQGVNNGFLYCRDKLGSSLRPVYGSAYGVPAELGSFDVVTFGSVLLHLRDPLGALLGILDRVRESVIITDRLPAWEDGRPLMEFIPKLELMKPWGGWSWWHMSPTVLERFFQVVGFKRVEVTTSGHLFVPLGKPIQLFTVVAHRSA